MEMSLRGTYTKQFLDLNFELNLQSNIRVLVKSESKVNRETIKLGPSITAKQCH